ncbi:YgfZ/GcvT domain-containing protein [Conexibacter arvalis]|uniref:Folate-binding Fe-S cluster repair protein YgfZ n=1 Tax=Conexibacter arvalis TaxID=912552 RepID=A0A840IB44_9ACTN|nr:hypothetical protein [Conexibacter arvalis]MBB4661298.1 folate-binding Fe-S cluster repair protein YgfZ [Conexibacter arvalis]
MAAALQLRDRSDAGKLAVSGPDAAAFLQALLTADLAGLAPGSGTATALLAPKGQVRALGRVLAVERGYLLHCERPALEGLFRGLWSGRVGWRVEIHKLTLQQGLVTVLGDDAAQRLGLSLPAGAPEHAHVATDLDGIPVRAVRSWAGVDLVVRADRVAALLEAVAARPACGACDEGSWTALRVAAGRLAYGCDAGEASLPAELALGEATVATGKGLYPGLQTVLRQQRSGTIHRRVCRVHAARALLAPGDELVAGGAGADRAGAGARVVGAVTSACAFDALAIVRTGAEGPLVHRETGTPVAVTPIDEARPSL